MIRTGFIHQSNGQSGGLSRSWNRVYADFIFERENLYLSFRTPWWRVPESKKNDDNPNIDKYLGNFELSGVYKKGEHNFNFMMRNNLRTGENLGAFQLGWSFSSPFVIQIMAEWYIPMV
ncbi:MAG: phospholipase A [Gammaproteobacteria bacterium]|nr:phospholipase A [Gammaproteobacteria bacterium]